MFLTRWITHFCAPGFLFLAGTSAYLSAKGHGDRVAQSRHLATRGLWLILLELTVLRLAWRFNGDVWNYNLAGVIWVIGWCLVGLAALVWLPLWAVAALGAIVVAGHDAFGPWLFADGGAIGGWPGQLLTRPAASASARTARVWSCCVGPPPGEHAHDDGERTGRVPAVRRPKAASSPARARATSVASGPPPSVMVRR